MTGGYGDPRPNHFHAGLDLSTRQRIGAPVVAPADGWVERVRTSGNGYGRSLYLRIADGRLVVFGHLDAFAPGVAAYVDSVQRATDEYEQDLWLGALRFPVAAGERVAWSGQSGAGPPHLHVEVRHGDFALNPLLAGLAVPDTIPPRLERLVLEPLDERSWVERGAAPRSHVLRDGADTLLVEGRVRLTLVASDATNASRGLPVRTVGARFGGAWVECRMDSVSWAGEMAQLGWLLDRGRVTGSDGVILDAPAGWRPRFLRTSRPDSVAVELVNVIPGAEPQVLELYANDAAGLGVTRRVWLRGPRSDERGPARHTSPAAKRSARKGPSRASLVAPSTPQWQFASLPDQRLRLSLRGAPPGLRDVRIERSERSVSEDDAATATWDGRAWTAVMHVTGTPDSKGFRIRGTLADSATWFHRASDPLWPSGTQLVARTEDWASVRVEREDVYEPGVLMLGTTVIAGLPARAVGVRAALHVRPVTPPLKRPARVALELPAGMSRDRVGLYRRDGDGERWEWIDADWDSVTREFRALPSRLGQFALVRDTTPPDVRVLKPSPRPRAGDYSTWGLSARVHDGASGVLARTSGFIVDGVRVPTEWDAEQRVLRWRPLVPPAPGQHRYRVEATDRAGNRAVRTGTFVIASR